MSFTLFEDANKDRILRFLTVMNEEFHPPLHARVNLNEYATKLAMHGVNFFLVAGNECGNEDVAHAGFYCNDLESGVAFISSIAVVPRFQGSEAAGYLLSQIIKTCRARHMTVLSLEVDRENVKAVRFYTRQGFSLLADTSLVTGTVMQKRLATTGESDIRQY